MLNDDDMTQVLRRAHVMRSQVLHDLIVAGWRALRSRIKLTSRTNAPV